MYTQVNEAQFIGGGRGFTIQNSYVRSCHRDWLNQRTAIYWQYDGRNFGGYGDQENIQMSANVYNTTGGGYNIGPVNYVYSLNGCCNISQGQYNTPDE